MKKLLFIVLAGLYFTNVKAQIQLLKEQSAVLDNLKKQGLLTGKEYIYNPSGTKGLQITSSGNRLARNGSPNSTMASSTACNCWIARDTSFHVVPFDGSGASGGPGVAPTYANDDWSTAGITLPFNFCLYGDTVGTATNKMFINNNGNISFGTPYQTFSSVAFPTNTYTMVAPFWGDVETTNPGSGFVYYQLTPTHLIVQWDSVTNFQTTPGSNTLKNTFQLIITNGIDSILPGGYNISFCYGDMQWTTGDASGGTNGFGGTPATVGINKGNGTNYIQISRFDTSGNTYTNPAGSPASGINWLSNSSFSFDACGSSTNLPPLTLSSSTPCTEDTLTTFAGDTLSQRLSFIGPEPSQNISVTASSPNLGSNFSVTSSIVSTIGSLNFRIDNNALPGNYNVAVTATDNGIPVQSTIVNYVIHVLPANVTTDIKKVNDKQISIYPNPNHGSFVIETNSTEKQLVQVYDVTGKVVLSQNIYGKTTIDAGNLNEGVYSVCVANNGGKINKRVVIVK